MREKMKGREGERVRETQREKEREYMKDAFPQITVSRYHQHHHRLLLFQIYCVPGSMVSCSECCELIIIVHIL
jgi:predicted metallo-beta-lactamase superfamily hydrolase